MCGVVRVLHCFEKMTRGGAESFAMNIYRKIDRSRVQFDFLVSKEGEYDSEIRSLGGKIHMIPPLTKVGPIRFKKELHDFFKKNTEYKIIHSHRNKVSGIILKEAKRAGIPLRIAHSHSTSDSGNFVIRMLKKFYQKDVLKCANYRIACGTESAKYLYGETDNVTIVKNGICSENYGYDANLREIKRNELSLTGKFVIGTTGRLETVKNHTFLLDVFNEIQRKNNDSVLLIIGTGSLKSELIEKARKLGIENKLIVMENRPDVNELLLTMDAFAMPSLYEGVPLSVIEAQCTGLKCFLSDRVTEEVKVTELVKFIPLEKGASFWAEEILSCSEYIRVQKDMEIQEAGYDILNSAKILENLYVTTFDKMNI